jgi:nucleoside-diphosphate-sugar epimerase
MKIIITGSRGFIGKNLLNNFPKKFKVQKLLFKKFSNLKENNFKKKLENKILSFKPDIVIHAATLFTKTNNLDVKKKCLKINYHYSKILLNIVIANKIKKFIYFGSNYEFEKNKKKIYPYLKSKQKFSKYLCKINSYNTKLLVFYLFNTFGENDKRNKLYSKIIKNPKKKIFFNLKLKLNYINIKSLTNYIKLQLLRNWNFKKRFISVANKKYFTVKDLKMLKINFLPDTHSTNLVLEHKLIIPLKKKYFYPNKDNSLYEFIKKKIYK